MFGLKKLFQAKQKMPVLEGEVAVADLLGLFGAEGIQTIYNPDELVTQKGLQVYDKMRRDDQVKAALIFKKNTVLASGWEVNSPEGMADDWEVTEHVKAVLTNMEGTFERTLINIMSALDYGYSVTEVIFDVGAGLKALKTRRPHFFDFDCDGHGNLKGLRQNGKELPLEKFIIYSYDKEFQNWYGNSDLRAAYRPWWAKDNAYKWLAIMLEKLGIPPIFAMYNPNSYVGTQQSELQKILKNFQASTVGLIPRGAAEDLEMWAPQLAGQAKEVFIPALDMFNKDIARALLMPGLLGMTPDDAQGSYARSKTHFDVFMLVIERIQRELEECIMQEKVIKLIVDFSYAGVKTYPKFSFLPISDQTRLDILAQWKELLDGGAVKPQAEDEKHIRSMLEFPPREAADEDYVPENDGNEEREILPEAIDDERRVFALNRIANDYERKVDFAAISSFLDGDEEAAITSLVSVIEDAKTKLVKQLGRLKSLSATEAVGIKLPAIESKLKALLSARAGELFYRGIEDIDAETGGAKKNNAQLLSEPGVIERDALSYLKGKTGIIASGVSRRVQEEVLFGLLQGIRTGETPRELSSRVESILQQYIGDPKIIKDDKVLQPYRIENIVRTQTAEAYNQGRLVAARRNSLVQALQYSAILDSRTTDVCSHLDKKIFRVGDAALDQLSPPNHYQCRSVLVPILIDEVIDEKDFIKPSQIGKAEELAFKGFV